jgi:hypothetical protein
MIIAHSDMGLTFGQAIILSSEELTKKTSAWRSQARDYSSSPVETIAQARDQFDFLSQGKNIYLYDVGQNPTISRNGVFSSFKALENAFFKNLSVNSQAIV